MLSRLPLLRSLLVFAAFFASGSLRAGSFVLDPPSPSWPDSNDILRDNPGPVPALPRLGAPAAALGLQAQDVIDALSDGRDPIDPERHAGSPRLIFSVTRSSVGVAGTDVEAERLGDTAPPAGARPNGHASDLFVWDGTYGSNQLAPAPLGWALGSQTGDEANCHLRLPGAGQPGDNVDAYDRGTLLFLATPDDNNPGGGAGAPPFPIFFSLRAGSPTLAMIGAFPGDVLAVGGPFGPSPVVFLSHAVLGIPPQADLDGLNLEVRQNAAGAIVLHRIRFSIDSATLGFALPGGVVVDSGAHVLALNGAATVIAIKADELGLQLTDDIDALESAFIFGGFEVGDGVVFDPLGDAVVQAAPAPGTISVSGLGASGQDGLSVELPPAIGWSARIWGDPHVDEKDTAKMRVRPVAAGGFLLPYIEQDNVDKVLRMSLDLATHVRVVGFQDDAEVFAREAPSSEIGEELVFPLGQPNGIIAILIGLLWQPSTDGQGPELAYEVSVPDGGTIVLGGLEGGSVESDKVRIVLQLPREVHDIHMNQGNASLVGFMATANVDLWIGSLETDPGVTQDGATHRRLGQARVTDAVEGGVEVANIGSSGQDGVSMELPRGGAVVEDLSLDFGQLRGQEASLAISFNFDRMARVDFGLLSSPLGFRVEIDGVAAGHVVAGGEGAGEGGGGEAPSGLRGALQGEAGLTALRVVRGGIELVFDGEMTFRPDDGGPAVEGASLVFLDVWEHALRLSKAEVRVSGVPSFRIASLEVSAGPTFRRGDSNGSGRVDIADPLRTLNVLFLGEATLLCDDAADANDDGAINIADAITTLNTLFVGSATIPAPGMLECGVDPTEDALGCAEEGACQ